MTLKLPKFSFLLLLLLASLIGRAQNGNSRITGIVVAEGGEALNGVSVLLRSVSGKENKSAMTNEKGIFTFQNLQPNVHYNISFSYIGYKDTVVSDFELNPNEANSL